MFEAIVFAVNDIGFRAKCARERLDSSQVRLHKIAALISASRYSIHDLSRTALDDVNSLPRFNMPLELGMDLGCKYFHPNCADKSLLIFDSEQYRFQKFVSDLSGQDIHRTQTIRRQPLPACATGSVPSQERPAYPEAPRSTRATKHSDLSCRIFARN